MSDKQQVQKPGFDSIKQTNPGGVEFWSARELSKLLGYTEWRNFDIAIKRAMIACKQTDNNTANHFVDSNKMVRLGSGANRQVKDYLLSRFACYLIAQNGDPSKPEIAAAQVYFAVSTLQNELREKADAQAERLKLRERADENEKALTDAARAAGVLPKNFGIFHQAGYRSMYGGLELEQIKERKGIAQKENLLDRAGVTELVANDFRITQTEAKIRSENIIGQQAAINAHQEVGQIVRRAITEVGNTMPEDLPAEPTIKPLVEERRRKQKKAIRMKEQPKLLDKPTTEKSL